jgi:hypothetical protein
VVYAKKKQAPKKQPSDAAAELEAQAAQEQQQQAEVPPATWPHVHVYLCNRLCSSYLNATLLMCCSCGEHMRATTCELHQPC